MISRPRGPESMDPLENGSSNDPPSDTTTCRKCRSSVPPDATRCPACGYDPSPGILGTLAYALALPFAGIGAVLVFASVLATGAGALTVGDAVGSIVATVLVFGPAWYGVWWYRRERVVGKV